MDLAAMPEKRFLAFSKMYNCNTIDLAAMPKKNAFGV
jgi:hypothetical protein